MSLAKREGMPRGASRRTRPLWTAPLPLVLLLFLVVAAGPATVQPADDQLEAARESVNAHRFDEAISHLQAELAKHPGNDEAMLLLARVLSWQHRYDESIAAYDRLLAKKPDDASLRADRARVLSWSGRHDEAIREFRAASAADTTNVETKIGLARTYSWSGDLAAASILYQDIVAEDPKQGDAWLGLASVARWRGAPTASDRFLGEAERAAADSEGMADERAATRDALQPSAGGGWTTSRERQYVSGPDFTIETEGPYIQGRATAGRAAQLSGRVSWLTHLETPTEGDSSNYDLESVEYRADVSLLRGYPWQAAIGAEYETFDQRGNGATLFPLGGDDDFFGWNGRLWRYTGRLTPRLGISRELVAIKETQPSGLREFQPGRIDNYEAGLAWQWSGRGTADGAAARSLYSDDNRGWMAAGGATYRVKTRVPTIAVDGRLTYRDWDFQSPNYFTPINSVKGAAGITLAGYNELSGVDYSVRYEFSGLGSSNFSDIWANVWSGSLSMTAFAAIPLSLEGLYSIDNNSYETWYVGLSASGRW